MYNLTNLTESQTTLDLFNYANETTGQVLGVLMLLSMFFVFFMTFKKNNEFVEALLSSSFICFVLSTLMAYGGFLNFIFVIFFLAMTALSLLFVYLTK